MKWLIGTVLTLIVITVAVGALYKPSVKATDTPTVLYSPQVLLSTLNKERAENGVAPLKLDPRLNASAQAKADDMRSNDYYGHLDKNGQRATTQIKGCEIPNENLTGADFGVNPIKRWDESPEHKKAQLNPNNEIVGFGAVIYNGKPVYVAHFCDL